MKAKWQPPKQQRSRAPKKATIVKGLLEGSVQYRCKICNAPRPIAKKSLKSHRNSNEKCLRKQRAITDLGELTRLAPAPLSADAARSAARSTVRAGI
jgi:hypothetical protein